MLVGIIIGAVVLLLIIFVISSYNKLVKQKVNVEEAFATMDVYLKKRFDLIPNLVETVKGYAKHEKETFEKVIKARNSFNEAKTPEDEMKANNEYLWETLIAKAGGKVDFKSDNATADDKTNYDVGVSVVPVTEDSLNVEEYNKDSSVVFTTDEIAFKSDSVEFVDEKQASQAVSTM